MRDALSNIFLQQLSCRSTSLQIIAEANANLTQSFVQLGQSRQGLDWITRTRYSFEVFSMSRASPPALSLVDDSKTLRYQQGDPADLL